MQTIAGTLIRTSIILEYIPYKDEVCKPRWKSRRPFLHRVEEKKNSEKIPNPWESENK